MSTFIVTSSLSGNKFDVLEKWEVKSEKGFSSLPLNNASNTDKQSQFSIVGGDVLSISFSIILRQDGVTAVIPQNILGNLYFNSFREKVAPVFTKSIRNLLKIRNHLRLLLNLEYGNISEETFDKEEPNYLAEIEKNPLEKLKEEIKVLFTFANTDSSFDSEDISEILNCSIDDAEKALNQYINGE